MLKNAISKRMAALGLSVAASLSVGYLTIPFEGKVTDKNGTHIVYKDPVGIPTACYGQTGNDLYGRQIKMGMKYSEDECLIMLSTSIRKFEKDLDKQVKVKYKSTYQKAALIDFTYNVGIGNVQSSTLLKKLNAKDHEGACDQLSRWVYAKGQKLPGLVIRREEEFNWCMGQVPYEVEITHMEITKMVANGLKTPLSNKE